MGLKEKYAQRKLNKLARNVKRNPRFPKLNAVKTVGVLWQPSQKEAYLYLKNYFKKEMVIFRGFCVFEEITNPQPDTNTITTADLNWWGLPKQGKTEDFINNNFDLLLNTALEQNFILNYMTALSRASFKVGWSPNETNYFDLNINIGKKDDAMYLVKQQIFYLAQLNKNNN